MPQNIKQLQSTKVKKNHQKNFLKILSIPELFVEVLANLVRREQNVLPLLRLLNPVNKINITGRFTFSTLVE